MVYPFSSCTSVKASLSAKPFVWNDFDLHENETACRIHFHKKGFALRLVLKQRHKRTRKWPISFRPVFNSVRLRFFMQISAPLGFCRDSGLGFQSCLSAMSLHHHKARKTCNLLPFLSLGIPGGVAKNFQCMNIFFSQSWRQEFFSHVEGLHEFYFSIFLVMLCKASDTC